MGDEEDVNSSDSEDFETTEEERLYSKICIFWDVVACPFPEEMDPNLIHQKIESALIERGSKGEMLIWAYVDEKKDCWGEVLRKKRTWKANLEFIPRGPKPSLRMLNDILLWATKSPVPTTLILVSDQVRGSALVTKRLQGLVVWRYLVYLVEPTDGCVVSPEWPGSLFDYPNPCKLRHKKCVPAKRKAVGEGSEDQEG